MSNSRNPHQPTDSPSQKRADKTLFGSKEGDIVIAVMGPPCSGKSTLIKNMLPEDADPKPKPNPRFAPSKPSIQEYSMKMPDINADGRIENRRLVLVDTPGFNNADVHDFDILQMMAGWLKSAYHKDFEISAIIYLFPLVAGVNPQKEERYLRVLRKVWGDDSTERVVLATTQWEIAGGDQDDREAELRGGFWKPMLELNASMTRLYNDRESAQGLLRNVLENVASQEFVGFVLALQHELEAKRIKLHKTDAGKELRKELKHGFSLREAIFNILKRFFPPPSSDTASR
ncbi:hypothetical protein FA15DRAFT_704211 [Coprinopsis marcescibilis]|uniref:G domain-containing protein n=1 Tax=Coprinopsis marcescibilis TaxID=230819 RepID=A0A5C3KWK2_COPMA|nr:hypothetical protein FA15DRAFT_704211 [Coprinopsis marcescibilis]